MRKDIIIGLGLLAAPIIAIAHSAPTPPPEDDAAANDSVGNDMVNKNWGNSAEPVPAPDDPLVNDISEGEKPDTPQEPPQR